MPPRSPPNPRERRRRRHEQCVGGGSERVRGRVRLPPSRPVLYGQTFHLKTLFFVFFLALQGQFSLSFACPPARSLPVLTSSKRLLRVETIDKSSAIDSPAHAAAPSIAAGALLSPPPPLCFFFRTESLEQRQNRTQGIEYGSCPSCDTHQ